MQLVIGASIVPVAFRVAVGLATDTGIGVCNSVYVRFLLVLTDGQYVHH